MKDTILLFVFGLFLLIKGGDWFVDAATGIARRFRVPEFIIGATVVSIGTTLPEVMVSATSAVEGHGEIAYGNAIGSVICNTALIAALTVAIRPSKVDRSSFRAPVLFFFGTAAYYMLNAYIFRTFNRFVGITLLLVFAAYVVYVLISAKKRRIAPDVETAPAEEDGEKKETETSLIKCIVLLVVGAACIAIGADLLVDKGTLIAQAMGVPESVIALTFVALGTSLPELATAITALVKGHGALSLGNIVGANLFNLALVSGLSITLNPFEIPVEKTLAGINASLLVDMPVMAAVMAILTVPALISGKLSRWQGITLLAVYAAFTVFQIAL
ncbi:MAG: calcium/sodium antiporter [Clostridia bacterium]|nr:calcium/sodium antiporter [Clostridia bacterium]